MQVKTVESNYRTQTQSLEIVQCDELEENLGRYYMEC